MSLTIGIGVTSYNRPKHLDLFIKQIGLFTNDYKLHIADDSKVNKGIAYRKNECLRALQECEHIFLFDDDCFPVRYGWVEFVLKASYASGQKHFLYLKETSTINKIATIGNVEVFNNCGGAFMYLHKSVIETVGAFNPSYGVYGYEHAGYTKRINKAGLTSYGEYICPIGLDKYIYAMDYDNYLSFNKDVGHKPSITDLNLLTQSINDNFEVFKNDTQIYIPL